MKQTIIGALVAVSILAPSFAFADFTTASANGSCDTPQPGISIQNADGSWTLHAAIAYLTGNGQWHLPC